MFESLVLAHTPVNNLHVYADPLSRTFIDPCSPDLPSAKWILIWVTANLHCVEDMMRDRDNGIVVVGFDTACAKTGTVVRQIAGVLFGISG